MRDADRCGLDATDLLERERPPRRHALAADRRAGRAWPGHRRAPGGPCGRACPPGSTAWRRRAYCTCSTVPTSSTSQLLSGLEYRRIYFNLIASRWPLRRLPQLRLEFPERYLAAEIDRDGGPFELHNVHLPPGVDARVGRRSRCSRPCTAGWPRPASSRGSCAATSTRHGLKREDGTVEFWGASHPKHRERWDAAERGVVLGLAEHDLPDTFRALNGYTATDASWVARRGDRQWGRRYDHIFASNQLTATACRYLHDWRTQGLSDHSAIEADLIG